MTVHVAVDVLNCGTADANSWRIHGEDDFWEGQNGDQGSRLWFEAGRGWISVAVALAKICSPFLGFMCFLMFLKLTSAK